MNIAKLQIKNFLSVSEVSITPGHVTQICGPNNSGKTTQLKAIEFALKGSTDGSLVKFGENEAEVIIDLSDQTQVRRRISPDGKQSVDVRRGEFKISAPQSFLDGLIDKSSFNPLELLDPKKRSDAIMASIEIEVTPEILAAELVVEISALPPLDYSQHGLKVLDQAHKFYYQRRAEANKDASDKRKRFETYKGDLPAKASAPALDITKVTATIARERTAIGAAKERLQRVDKEIMDAKVISSRVSQYTIVISQIDNDLAALDQRLRELRIKRESAMRSKAEAEQDLPKSLPDKSEIESEIAQREGVIAHNNQSLAELDRAKAVEKQYAMVADIKTEVDVATAFAESLTSKVEALAGSVKQRFMSRSEMPIAGLQYVAGEFQVDGVPVDNLSSSRALKLAIGVARKLARKTKLICIDGAEALDQNSYEALRKEIEGDGYSYFISKVGEPFEGGHDTVVRMNGGRAEVRA